MSNVLLFSNVYSAFKWLPISNDLLLVLGLKGKYLKKQVDSSLSKSQALISSTYFNYHIKNLKRE